jgi:hypothetical protein
MSVFAGEPSCPSCTSYTTTPAVELVSLADPLEDGDEEPLPGYDQWCAQVEAADELADLREWARQSLACAPIACTCNRHQVCLRCRCQAIVDSRR